MIIARRAMKHFFFLTIYFYAPSYPPFDFFSSLLLFNAKRHFKSKQLEKFTKPPFYKGIGGCVIWSSFPHNFNIRRAEPRKKKHKQTREKTRLEKGERESYWRFAVSLCFFENIYSYSGVRRIRWFCEYSSRSRLFIYSFYFSLTWLPPFSPLYSFLWLMKVKNGVFILFCFFSGNFFNILINSNKYYVI